MTVIPGEAPDTMPSAPTLQSFLPLKTRDRGASYLHDGRVRIVKSDDHSVEAQVRGSKMYEVCLRRNEETLFVQCSCEFFIREFEPCKHIWASILACDITNLLAEEPPPAFLECFDEWIDTEELDPLERTWRPSGVRPLALAPDAAAIKALPEWKKTLRDLRVSHFDRPLSEACLPQSRIDYVIDADFSENGWNLKLQILYRRPRVGDKTTWTKQKPIRLTRTEIAQLPDPLDREIISLLVAGRSEYASMYALTTDFDALYIAATTASSILPHLCRTGRLVLRRRAWRGDGPPLRWDDGPPWQLRFDLNPLDDSYLLSGQLVRGEETMDSAAVELICPGVVFTRDTVAALDPAAGIEWLRLFRARKPLSIPSAGAEEFVYEVLSIPERPPLSFPPELRWDEIRMAPSPRLRLKVPDSGNPITATLMFDYGGTLIPQGDDSMAIIDRASRRSVVRDLAAEGRLTERMREAGFRDQWIRDLGARWPAIPASRMPAAVRDLVREGWEVEAEGKKIRNASSVQARVSSGVDWFDLEGEASYDGESVSLPKLLAAVRRGETMVRLGDGGFGIIPEDWLARYRPVATLGTVADDSIRFRRSQAGFLDALLDAQPETSADELFSATREKLAHFSGIEAAPAPAGFVGTLRPYQEEGLGWFGFLQQYGFGGCLADDMGLGKTIQVLALLEGRRVMAEGNRKKPSLVVAPKSLIFNWQDEAARFTPGLRVLDHTGIERVSGTEHFGDYDVVLTTYGTLRREVAVLAGTEFDYVILDEAQAVKNATTQSSKSVRLLRADHRLALSGTPIENHLGELWSLFDFLNPGLLGASTTFQKFAAGAERVGRSLDEETRNVLRRALRPYILRRTKAEVAKDLPDRTEQTIYCSMDARQRKTYDELRDYYRQSLQQRIKDVGLAKAKIHVLEALLRLRQAACHPGLIDPVRRREPSAKIDALLPQLREITEEGHKVLVFSQFTSFLSIVRERLEEEGVAYCYLDGKTMDRAAQVDRFQNDPSVGLFLISLKAGGLGLNLTAAEYVFLLDPWWNPAVEAQAIDRAHRIGQTRQVFAYRLVCKDTVEEKILEMQDTKRELADAILSADQPTLRTLTADDIQMLLS
jgi:superfamily II DNA or RNA helicase